MSFFFRPGRSIDLKKFGEISSLVMILPSSIAVGLIIGYHLDKWLKTQPWMLLIWTIMGVVSGILNLWRGVKKYLEDGEQVRKNKERSEER